MNVNENPSDSGIFLKDLAPSRGQNRETVGYRDFLKGKKLSAKRKAAKAAFPAKNSIPGTKCSLNSVKDPPFATGAVRLDPVLAPETAHHTIEAARIKTANIRRNRMFM